MVYTGIMVEREKNPKGKKMELADFAEIVVFAATRSETGRFGPAKVFINHVWKKYVTWMRNGVSLDDFKARLLEAHRAGLLTLSRADLVSAMDATDVRLSEISSGVQTYNFILSKRR